ncbi:hypothetical protein QG37_06731 [Candidozyma auris]|uniref:Uncharacterized protein n=1 Tax=Candidozyma auris TaxID=498019 RepID=A0A0L0NRT8_CANAR|nr:hypothetical protein QG37_06731 [[Candida] auris]
MVKKTIQEVWAQSGKEAEEAENTVLNYCFSRALEG